MEKRFIIINCNALGDQYECDADRQILPRLFTLEEVQAYTSKRKYSVDEFGGWFDTKQEALDAFNKAFREDFKWWKAEGIRTVKEALDYCGGIRTWAKEQVEVHEIMDDGTIKERPDLSTYES